jgi:hypothetical protein
MRRYSYKSQVLRFLHSFPGPVKSEQRPANTGFRAPSQRWELRSCCFILLTSHTSKAMPKKKNNKWSRVQPIHGYHASALPHSIFRMSSCFFNQNSVLAKPPTDVAARLSNMCNTEAHKLGIPSGMQPRNILQADRWRYGAAETKQTDITSGFHLFRRWGLRWRWRRWRL